MIAANYPAYLTGLSRINPIDYQDAGTQAHLMAQGAALDDLKARARAVMAARLILYAPEDALERIGIERGLRRFPREPTGIYRARVLRAWEYWRLAGTVPGMIQALAAAGYRAIILEHWRDPDPEHWAEFSVTVGPLEPLPTDATWNGGATFGSGAAWGFQLPAVPLDSLTDLVREVKPAHARLRQLVWSPRGRYWGGGVEWNEGRVPLPVLPGWGVQTGFLTPPDADRTDNGPGWGESDNEIIYELKR